MTAREDAAETLAEARTLVLVAASVISRAADLVGALETPRAHALAEDLGGREDDLYTSYGRLGEALRGLQSNTD